jgi:beta-phosphoglucomutase-like phosphatase (HAD superfamily)
LVLDRMSLRELFRAVVTREDVTRGKPDPQVFQIAARRLEAPPARCVVIEDAPAGLAAAAAADMAGVGLVSTGRTRDILARADLLVDSLAELSPEVLREVISRRAGRRPPPSERLDCGWKTRGCPG